MTTFVRWMVLAALFAPLVGGQAFGQETPRGSGKYGWAGKVTDVGELQKQLESAVVRYRIQREFGPAEAILDEIWMRSMSVHGFPDQVDLLVRITLARSELYESQGRIAEALGTLDRLLLDRDDPRWKDERDALVPAGDVFAEKIAEALKDVRLVTRRKELLTRADPAIQGLEETIRANIETGDFQLVYAVGSRAIPILSEVVLEQPDDLPKEVRWDPLYHLIGLGERHAADLILRNFGKGGYAWHQRIVRAMDVQDVFEGEDKWTERPQPTAPRTYLAPAWLEILTRLLREPGSARDALDLVQHVIEYDGLTPELVAALDAALDSPDADLVQDTLRVLRYGGTRYSTKPVLEHAIGHGDVHIRRFAADKLRWYAESPALQARVTDPDPVVRLQLAHSLGRRSHQNTSLGPTTSPTGIAALRTLVADDDVQVRRAAVESLIDLPEPVEREVYLRLLEDPDPAVRAHLAWLRHPDSDFGATVLGKLAEDSDPDVLKAVDERIHPDEIGDDVEAVLKAAETRLTARVQPMMENHRRNVIYHLARSDAGLAGLVDAAVESGDDSVIALAWNNRNAAFSSTGHGERAFLALDDERLAAFFVLVARVDEQYHYTLRNAVVRSDPPRWEAMRRVLADANAPANVRLVAASTAAEGGGEAFRAAMIDLMTDEYWATRVPSEAEVKTLGNLASELPRGDRNRFLLDVARDRAIREELCEPLLQQYQPAEPFGREVTLAILDRWFDESGSTFQPVVTAITHMRALPKDADAELLKSAVRNSAYAVVAVETMGTLRDPVYLETLGACINPDWIYDQRTHSRVFNAATSALAGYLSDEAAEILLRGMTMATDRNVRKACSGALDSIQAFKDTLRSWEERKERRLERDDAVVKLLELLRDGDPVIRAEAARGLGTLGAAEYIPRLIEMLRDEDPGVKEAVRKALDRLNQEAAKPENG